MAGLGQALAGGAQHAEPDMDQQGGPSDGDQDNAANVSPEEQAQYDKFVLNAVKVIFPEASPDALGAGEVDVQDPALGKPSPQIIQSLQSTDNPIASLAQTAVQLIASLDSSAQRSGLRLEDDALYEAGTSVLEILASVAQMQGSHDFSDDEMEQALYHALDIYKDGPGKDRVNQADAKGEWDEFVAEQGGDPAQVDAAATQAAQQAPPQQQMGA